MPMLSKKALPSNSDAEVSSQLDGGLKDSSRSLLLFSIKFKIVRTQMINYRHTLFISSNESRHLFRDSQLATVINFAFKCRVAATATLYGM